MDMGLFLNFSIYQMNITFWFMETLLKINASIFSPAEIGAALADFVRGLRGRLFHQPIVRRSVTWKN
jgi:hypothetical protein